MLQAYKFTEKRIADFAKEIRRKIFKAGGGDTSLINQEWNEVLAEAALSDAGICKTLEQNHDFAFTYKHDIDGIKAVRVRFYVKGNVATR